MVTISLGFPQTEPFTDNKKELERLKRWEKILETIDKIGFLMPEADKEAKKKLPYIRAKMKKLEKVV